MALLSTSQKSQAEAMLDMVFDTYKRSVVVYLHPQDVVDDSSPAFNFAYPEEQNPEAVVTHTPVSGVFDATIEYISSQEAQKQLFAEANVNMDKNKSVAHLSTRVDGRDFLEQSERIEFDGKNHTIIAGPMPRGLFDPNYYDFWLQETD